MSQHPDREASTPRRRVIEDHRHGTVEFMLTPATEEYVRRLEAALDKIWAITDSEMADDDPCGALELIADIASDFDASERI